jgi:hypothetical protein
MRFKARVVLGRSDAGIVSSNPLRDVNISPRTFYIVLFSVGTDLAMGRSHIREVLPKFLKVFIVIMLCVSLSLRHRASMCCGWRRLPPDMENSCQYIE